MTLSRRSVAIGVILMLLLGFIAGGVLGFSNYVPGRAPMWPMWPMLLLPLVIWIPLAIRGRRRRRSH